MISFYRWHQFYVYGQDQWRIRPNLTLSYGVRYEYPGDSFQYLRELNQRILAANNNDPAYRFDAPKKDTNNWMPRVGFNWNPQTSDKGLMSLLTGGNRLVLRAGYARTYDASFVNLNTSILLFVPFRSDASQIAGAEWLYHSDQYHCSEHFKPRSTQSFDCLRRLSRTRRRSNLARCSAGAKH